MKMKRSIAMAMPAAVLWTSPKAYAKEDAEG